MGSILNSKAEYNRCHIPRLRVEEEEEGKEREEPSKRNREQTAKELDEEQINWELRKTSEIDKERRSRVTLCLTVGSRKRREEEEPNTELGSKGRRRKRLKYALMEENWGAPDNLEQQEEEHRKEEREEEQRIMVEGGGASMLPLIPTPDKGEVDRGGMTPFKDNPAMAV